MSSVSSACCTACWARATASAASRSAACLWPDVSAAVSALRSSRSHLAFSSATVCAASCELQSSRLLASSKLDQEDKILRKWGRGVAFD